MATRQIRNQPFCWQEKKINRLIRKIHFNDRAFKSKLLLLYATITEIDNDFNGKAIKYYTKTIVSYSGLSKEFIPNGLRELERLGIIKLTESRKGDGKYSGKTIFFTPELIDESASIEVETYAKPVNGEAVNGRPVNGELATLEESNSIEEKKIKEEILFSNSHELGEQTNIYEFVEPTKNDDAVEKKKKRPERSSEEEKQINEVINIFKLGINPMIKFFRLDVRDASFDLIKQLGFDRTCKIAEYAISIQTREYSPTITTPSQLRDKLPQVQKFYELNDKKKIKAISECKQNISKYEEEEVALRKSLREK